MKKFISLVAALGVCAAMPAAAANMNKDHSKKMDKWFNKMDANGDGMISESEHEAFGERMFEEADSNEDGMISRKEMRAQHERERSRHAGKAYGSENDLNPASGSQLGASSSTKRSEVLGTRDMRDEGGKNY